MFRDRFVACLKVKGEILREDKETVRIPFGSEYTLSLKNLHSRRAVVRVEIDGQDALDGRRLVVEPNTTLELERFIRGGDLAKGNRFRFIQKTEKIKQHRGDRVDDGIVRISWQWEAPAPQPVIIREYHPYPIYPLYPWPRPWWDSGITYNNGQIVTTYKGDTTSGSVMYRYATGTVTTYNATNHTLTASSVPAGATLQGASNSVNFQGQSFDVMVPVANTPTPTEGITVPGAESRQSFSAVYVPNLEPEEHVMVLKLLGESPTTGEAITQPLTVKEKLECPTCGTSNKSSHKFCNECGTCLGD